MWMLQNCSNNNGSIAFMSKNKRRLDCNVYQRDKFDKHLASEYRNPYWEVLKILIKIEANIKGQTLKNMKLID